MKRPRSAWRYLRGLTPPFILFGLLVAALVYTLQTRLSGDEQYDESALREWVLEARVFRDTMPELVRDLFEKYPADGDPSLHEDHLESIRENLAVLGQITRDYQTQLPLFPLIYRLELELQPPPKQPLFWDSQLPRRQDSANIRRFQLYAKDGKSAVLKVDYQLHIFAERQEALARQQARLRQGIGLLAMAAALIALIWVLLFFRGERNRERQQYQAQLRVDRAEREALESQILHQGAEHSREETERKLLEQRLATQDAEQRALEMKSKLYADISIMAGSYAHNIKNLLVRPNDLIRRCLESSTLPTSESQHLKEVQDTLRAVTERTQQILRTVRRDPTTADLSVCCLNDLLNDLHRTWTDVAEQRWKMHLVLDVPSGKLNVRGDASHLMQMVENLLFNARDAVFEKRNHLRTDARMKAFASDQEKREALIAVAGWKGRVTLRVRHEDRQALVEVEDNGMGMSNDVRQRCTETHFTTKRNNALYEGNSTGMGLGLSFVASVVEKHVGQLAILSTPGEGSTFQVRLDVLEIGADPSIRTTSASSTSEPNPIRK